MNNKKLIEPEITIIIYRDGKRLYRYPTHRKARIFANSEARKLEDEGISMTLRIIYGKVYSDLGDSETVENEMTTTSQQEFKQALEAFLDKDLWLKGHNDDLV